ncbi:DUF1549 and DUF1553 domain-containing protein [Bryobacter aggregatus]|uniref:DUF1549 and DUF1553 domain-containing protein n=1 Tax=Bryobacter aggregatus TaxID=360054 RepID=UPI0004E1FFD9|nr:DUF1549 and DUF1553 domain-containing protein [Bryobacter aggregatus]
MRKPFQFVLLVLCTGALQAQDTGAEFFESKVRPILATNCTGCHNSKMKAAGIDLSSTSGIAALDVNRLLAVVSYEQRVKMPPTGRLAASDLAMLNAWKQMGAALPSYQAALTAQAPNWPEARRKHWAIQPIQKPGIPLVANTAWAKSPVDAFLMAKLEKAGLPAPKPADKRSLLRRAKYDLLGLPPTEQEIRTFLADTAPDAFSRLVDQFLASPQYGEKWARHWLDVARFADTAGVDENAAYTEAWRYREYVIDAFNRDLPFDRFTREQIAGDLLPAEDGSAVNTRGIVATGFLGLGPKAIVEIDKRKEFYDVVDEQIDTTSKAFLGLTVACARCHDHKFDPISTKDYYSLAAIFSNTQSYEQQVKRGSSVYLTPLVDQQAYGVYKKHQARIAAKNMQAAALLDTEIWSASQTRLFPRIPEYMVSAWKVHHQNANVEELAKTHNLDLQILKGWVRYLEPGGFRPHLKEWMDAQAADIDKLAQVYAARFEKTAKLWGPILTKWKTDTNAAALAETELPKTPNIEYGDAATREAFNEPSTRFFIDIIIPARTLNDPTSIDGPFVLKEERHKDFLSAAILTEWKALKDQSAALTAALPPSPPMANSVGEGPALKQHIFIRGSYDNPGAEVERGFPEIIRGKSKVDGPGSGRKELADWLTHPANPLPARVIVNRIWGWHFGDGLVRTPNNFGLTGDAPTHPQLLDFLATRFVESGWSIKAMHRLLMLSNAYQSDSGITPAMWSIDPGNKLWSRFKRRRIDIEELRDTYLQLGGTLSLRMGGIFDRVEAPAPRKRDANTPAPFDTSQRRTVYLPVNRNGIATPLSLNDFVDSTTSSGARSETIIAPQALYLMNNAFVTARAADFAKQVLSAEGLSDAGYVRRAWRLALTRDPDPVDIETAVTFLKQHPVQQDAWTSYCRVLLSTNQLHYID